MRRQIPLKIKISRDIVESVIDVGSGFFLAIIIQLFLSIKSFQHDLLKLHKAQNVFGSLINNYDFKKYAKIIKRRNRMSSEITSDSIHYPGYLIAHFVDGYLVLFW